MASNGKMFLPNFIKTGSEVEPVGTQRQKDTQTISLPLTLICLPPPSTLTHTCHDDLIYFIKILGNPELNYNKK
jgi:hypothetical protein